MTSWTRHVIWWQVYPLGFTGAEPVNESPAAADVEVRHRLPQLTDWLDYAVELGVNGLALQPVFASQSHGYDTVDYYRVDPRLGDEADLKGLIDAAKRRGIRVLLDGVFNHVGSAHPAFADVVEHGPQSPTASWFRLDFDGWAPGSAPGYESFEGHAQLVALNHDSPDVADMVTEVMCHWLEQGIDGWRLDAAYAVPTAFWASVLPRVRERFPDAYVVGEVIHGDYAQIVTESTMDATTQYELWKAVWSSLNDGNFHELAHALGRHNDFLDTFVPMTFIGNHDVTRIASQLEDAADLPLAFGVLMSVPGTPSIYYGDEQAMRGIKEDRLGGDDAIRPAFPARPDDLDPEGWPAYRTHQKLIGIRRRNAWLHDARTEVTHVTNTGLVFTTSDGEHTVLTALNCAEDGVSLPLPRDRAGAQIEACAQEAFIAKDSRAISLPPHGWAVVGYSASSSD